jgi:LCP family protein required for cell wall assembly
MSTKKKIIIGLVMFLAFIAIGGIVIGAVYSEQVNIVVMGVEGTRTDTLFFMTIDTKSNTVKALSIPRDTYAPTEGKNGLGQKKINAVYGFKDNGGIEGVVRTVENLLNVKVDHYVKVDYDGVEAIIDLIGGVEVDVPIRMLYDDPYSIPPLHIDFQPGLQTIHGDQAMAYLRFRKSNDGKISGGDVQRIERQQDFLVNAAKGLITPKLPYIAYQAMTYVDTDMSAAKAALLGTAMYGVDKESVEFQTLPEDYIGSGKDGLSYFFHDSEATQALMNEWFQ